jgi:hypothetical protein
MPTCDVVGVAAAWNQRVGLTGREVEHCHLCGIKASRLAVMVNNTPAVRQHLRPEVIELAARRVRLRKHGHHAANRRVRAAGRWPDPTWQR